MQAQRISCDDDELRREPRDAVQFRAHGFGPDARALALDVLNLSPFGLMAQAGRALAAGDRLRLILPGTGVVAAEVRWSEKGRIGCRFDMPFQGASYYELLAAVLKG